MTSPTIGVFDSGFGGLTVLRDLLPLVPSARYLYLGDTARLPYGSKSRETVARYAVSSGRFLLARGADLLVVACNTATALALPDLQTDLPIPVIGVIGPGTDAARRLALVPHLASIADAQPHVLVLATDATVQSGAYTAALSAAGLQAFEKACPLLVPLVEEGWVDHPVTREVVRIYLTEALAACPSASALLLGCTHYPLLRPVFEQTLTCLGHPMPIIDSAQATAEAVAAHLAPQTPTPALDTPAPCTFFATDSVAKFQRLGPHFLGRPVPEVRLVDLGG